MAKKSQTNARRKNTQVGQQVVNFYNNGTGNVDARQNNSVSPKSTYTYCTLNYAPPTPRPFTLKDQLGGGHPILGMVSPEVITTATKVHTPDEIKGTKCNTNTEKTVNWGGIVIGATGVAAVLWLAVFGLVKYLNN